MIIIAGIPGTGKTTFARYLSGKMKVPMCSKDILKEHLFDTIGFGNREEKVRLGIAAMDLLYHFADEHLKIGLPVILENNFENISKPGLMKLIDTYKCRTVTIKFYCEPAVLANRFLIRDRSPERHRGHVINTKYPEEEGQEEQSFLSGAIYPESYFTVMDARGMGSFTIGGDEINVDSTDFSKVFYEEIYERIKSIIA